MQKLYSLSQGPDVFVHQIQYRGPKLDRWLLTPIVLILSPLLLVNIFIALLLREPVFSVVREIDALGRLIEKRVFSFGWCKKSASLLDIITGRYSLCGVSTTHRLNPKEQDDILKHFAIPTGLFSLVDVHKIIGLADTHTAQLIVQQAKGNYKNYIALLFKGLLCRLFFSAEQKLDCDSFSIFDVQITNDDMQTAVERVVSEKPVYASRPNVGFFVNAHSLNLAQRSKEFKSLLSTSDWRFADGSGVRVAALSKGYHLKDNVNGTDMLPPLCRACVEHDRRIFLLGAAPGVAQSTATKLMEAFPGLQVAGTEHGFVSDYSDVIQRINAAQTDVLLVAMGSPNQENWIETHKYQLHCNSVLAVGGLFDFYSGRIPRAPRWMREIGMEWLFRLYQEPVNKFTRYVLGTPEFLIRTFILKQA